MSLADELDKMIAEEVTKTANELKDAMQGIVHVRTGNLRDSITVEPGDSEKEKYVGVDADQLESDSRNPNGFDYSTVYYYGRRDGSWVGHKFLEEAMNSIK